MLGGKNVLITGASSGIGKAMAEHLSSQGANVVLVARRKEQLEKVADKIGPNAFIYPCDLENTETIEDIFSFIKSLGLKLDGIVHCAGLTASIPLKVNNIAIMDSIMKINVEAFAQLCKFASSKRYTNDGCTIIGMSSTASLCGDKGLAIYSASKAAVNVLVKSAALELAPRKIRVVAIAPVMVRTEMYYNTIKEIPAMEGIVAANQPLGLIEPEYLAYLAEFLMTDKAKYITGTVIVVGAGHIF